jgi:mRNA-degrading endonuclease RelE of RelBE toxin-antitoxin system
MEIIQTNRFKKAYKKLTKNQLALVNEAIRVVLANPQIGEQKKGDLSWLRVYKFKCLNQLVLLGYSLGKTQVSLILVDIGSHENFYRDLKNVVLP